LCNVLTSFLTVVHFRKRTHTKARPETDDPRLKVGGFYNSGET